MTELRDLNAQVAEPSGDRCRSDAPVLVERRGHVLMIGVNRAHKRNAWDLATIDAVGPPTSARQRPRPARRGRARRGRALLGGPGPGGGRPAVAASGPPALSGGHLYDPFGVWAPPVPKPVVMAVQGITYTLSIELALASDIVVAASDVRFRQLEVGRGILPFGGATVRAQSSLGWGNAMAFLLTAEEFGAEEALRIGLVQRVVAPGEQLAEALRIAELIAAQAPLGVQATLSNARVARAEGPDAAIGAAARDAARDHGQPGRGRGPALVRRAADRLLHRPLSLRFDKRGPPIRP